jgi:hypothetical protein
MTGTEFLMKNSSTHGQTFKIRFTTLFYRPILTIDEI